jgi:hypothetical protein
MEKQVNFQVAITEIHPQIPWKLVADPLGSMEHTLGITGLDHYQRKQHKTWF